SLSAPAPTADPTRRRCRVTERKACWRIAQIAEGTVKSYLALERRPAWARCLRHGSASLSDGEHSRTVSLSKGSGRAPRYVAGAVRTCNATVAATRNQLTAPRFPVQSGKEQAWTSLTGQLTNLRTFNCRQQPLIVSGALS